MTDTEIIQNISSGKHLLSVGLCIRDIFIAENGARIPTIIINKIVFH
jgi:hypothetical protein